MSVTKPVKCFICPDKKPTLTDNNSSVYSGCGERYHPSCATRGKPNDKGVFAACCGIKKDDSEGNDGDNDNIDDLDKNSKLLYKLISKEFKSSIQVVNKKLGDLDIKLDKTVIRLDQRILDIEGRLESVEENSLHLVENTIAEMMDRKFRERNVILYNLPDSKNAAKSDCQKFIELLSPCSDDLPFKIGDIKVRRLGNKFVNGKVRPLKITLPTVNDVHWLFHHKRDICKDKLFISGDLTTMQRQYKSRVINELKQRKEDGESDLVIKYVRGVPTIISKSKQSVDTSVDSTE